MKKVRKLQHDQSDRNTWLFFERILNSIAWRRMLNHRLTFISVWIRLVTSVFVVSDGCGSIHVLFWILWWGNVLVLFSKTESHCYFYDGASFSLFLLKWTAIAISVAKTMRQTGTTCSKQPEFRWCNALGAYSWETTPTERNDYTSSRKIQHKRAAVQLLAFDVPILEPLGVIGRVRLMYFGVFLGPLGAILRPCWGHRPRALDVLSVMARSSIQIDTITCNADVSAWEKGGECLSQHCYGYVEPTWLQICWAQNGLEPNWLQIGWAEHGRTHLEPKWLRIGLRDKGDTRKKISDERRMWRVKRVRVVTSYACMIMSWYHHIMIWWYDDIIISSHKCRTPRKIRGFRHLKT